jgi:hypothetical protein
MSMNKFGWVAVLAWAALIVVATIFMGCQQYDYIHEKDGEITKISIDILGTDSIRSGMKLKLPTVTFELEESTLDTESIQKILEEFGNMDLIEILKLLGAL